MNQTGSSDNKYQYAGEQFDSTTGDYYLRQRFYDTSSGRFGRKDSYESGIGELSNKNQYLYAGSNPINLTDPTGLFELTMGGLTEVQIVSGILASIGAVGTYVTYQDRLMPLAEPIVEAFARAMEMSESLARNLNRKLRVPIVFWGSDLPEITDHQFRAITGRGYTIHNPDGNGIALPISPALNRRERSYDREPWIGRTAQAKGRNRANQCDEFPYAITEEGGERNYQRGGVSLHILNGSQNGSNGSRLRTFMNKAEVTHITKNPRNSLFLNIPVPSLGISFGLKRNGQPISIFNG